MATVVTDRFEWDSNKAESNLAKHGVSFDEAMSVFADPAAVYLGDELAEQEERFAVIGMSRAARVLLVVHVERSERDRIISARPATAVEERIYIERP